jgi:tetratricopeptide (TPR) repeat protein
VGDLFTVEYFEEAKAHLKPGGLMTAWLALYHMGDREFRATLKSFVTVFPHATLWFSNEGDVVLVGSFSPLDFGEELLARMEQPGVREDLERVGIAEASDILSALLMDGEQLRRYTAAVDVLHTDDNMLLEYFASRRVTKTTNTDHLSNFMEVFSPAHFADLTQKLNQNVAAKIKAKKMTMAGSIQRVRGNGQRAMELYELAYSTAPSDRYVASVYGQVHSDIGDLFRDRGECDQAIEHYRKAAGNMEQHVAWVPHDGLGYCYISKGMYEEAREELLTALRLNPYSVGSFYNLGVASSVLGDTVMAVEAYERLLKQVPDNAEAANNLAWLFAVRGENLDRALELARRASEISPIANHFDTLGWVYYKMGDLANARSALERALEMQPGGLETMYHLAVVHVGAGDEAEARALLEDIIAMDQGGEFGTKAGELLDGMGKE